MLKVPFAIGDRVQTRVAKPCYYSDYGLYPGYTIETGEIGTVVSVGIAPVRGPRQTDMTKVQFGHVQLKDTDRYGEICQSYFPEQIKRVDPMAPDVAKYMIAKHQVVHLKCSVCSTFLYVQMNILYNSKHEPVSLYRIDRDGRSYGLLDLQTLKACCGVPLQARRVRGVYDQTVTCGKKCYDAKTRDCTCSCSGILHGVSHAAQW